MIIKENHQVKRRKKMGSFERMRGGSWSHMVPFLARQLGLSVRIQRTPNSWLRKKEPRPNLRKEIPISAYLASSTVPKKAFWVGQLKLREHLIRELTRAKKSRGIKLIKVSIGESCLYHIIDGEGIKLANGTLSKGGLKDLIWEEKRGVIRHECRMTSNLGSVKLSPNHPFYGIRSPTAPLIPTSKLMAIITPIASPILFWFFISILVKPDPGPFFTPISKPSGHIYIRSLKCGVVRVEIEENLNEGVSWATGDEMARVGMRAPFVSTLFRAIIFLSCFER